MARAAQVGKQNQSSLTTKQNDKQLQEKRRLEKEQQKMADLERRQQELKAREKAVERRMQQLTHEKGQRRPLPATSTAERANTRQTPAQRKSTGTASAGARKNTSSKPRTPKKAPVYERKPDPGTEKKRAMSFQELMAAAKDKATGKKQIPKEASSATTSEPEDRGRERKMARPIPPAPRRDAAMERSTPTINTSASRSREKMAATSSPSTGSPSSSSSSSLFMKKKVGNGFKSGGLGRAGSTLTTRERLMQQHDTRPQKVVGAKRDRQTIEDIQQELRASKRGPDVPTPPTRRPEPARGNQPFRMPFRRAPAPRRSRYDEEEDEYDEDDDFVVRDDEVDDNDYSSEIRKMFKYDRRRYADEAAFSDDDMEADSRQVLMEEKRSARLAREEDLREERLEMERQRRRNGKGR
ncbi:hypothetical protein BC940DRAFT_293683 [Gongronella butleri]|nr:hypothetical protein BC940DRAFT_293683 [Gongronella butleri]